MSVSNQIYLIEACNFINFPLGGQLTFCCQLIDAFPASTFRLVGVTTGVDQEVGVWQKVIISGKEIDFFAVTRIVETQSVPIVPRRLNFYASLVYYRNRIFGADSSRLFTHAPETLIALSALKNAEIFHFFHGLDNPLIYSRYSFGRRLSRLYEYFLSKNLSRVSYFGAASGLGVINQFSSKYGLDVPVISFPTRYDEAFFYSTKTEKPRSTVPVFSFSGRLNKVKGLDLIIEAFKHYLDSFGDARLLIAGGGELETELKRRVSQLGLETKVFLLGVLNKRAMGEMLRSSDVFLMGSHLEGWPTSLVEAMACGLPVVTTDVNGARDLVKIGVNGFIAKERKPEIYADLMQKSLGLPTPNKESITSVASFKLSNMSQDLRALFPSFFRGSAD